MDSSRILPSLNPCSNGIPSDSHNRHISKVGCGSLNPCSNGIPSDCIIGNHNGYALRVLILVLMEYPLTQLNSIRVMKTKVLILVLMEYPLTITVISSTDLYEVLILVLMEYPLTSYERTRSSSEKS